MPDTANLILPLMSAAQSQKHVTHNEAVLRLDALVQLAVKSTTLTAPPGSPADGDRYLIASGATGAWAGKDLNITYYSSGEWVFLPPRKGWLCWDEVNGRLLTYKGAPTYWTQDVINAASLATLLASGTPATRIGINTASDANNRLAVKANSFFFSHDDVTPGTGDMRGSLNKSTSAKDVSLTFNTNWSSRAILGLLADDNFSIKVSPNGTTFYNPLTINSSNGWIYFAGVPGLTPSYSAPVTFQNNDGNYNCIIAGSGGNFRWAFGTDISANAVLFTFNSVDLRAGVGPAPVGLVIKNGGLVSLNTASSIDTVTINGNTSPLVDNSYALGKSSNRWSSVWAANGTIQTSDARLKTVEADVNADLAYSLISTIKPKFFRWKNGGTIVSSTPIDNSSKIINENEVKNFNLELEKLKNMGKGAKLAGSMPEFEKAKANTPCYVTAKPGKRRHAGFLAQDFEEAFKKFNTDFGAWGTDTDADSTQWLRPDQLIPILWAAVAKLIEEKK